MSTNPPPGCKGRIDAVPSTEGQRRPPTPRRPEPTGAGARAARRAGRVPTGRKRVRSESRSPISPMSQCRPPGAPSVTTITRSRAGWSRASSSAPHTSPLPRMVARRKKRWALMTVRGVASSGSSSKGWLSAVYGTRKKRASRCRLSSSASTCGSSASLRRPPSDRSFQRDPEKSTRIATRSLRRSIRPSAATLWPAGSTDASAGRGSAPARQESRIPSSAPRQERTCPPCSSPVARPSARTTASRTHGRSSSSSLSTSASRTIRSVNRGEPRHGADGGRLVGRAFTKSAPPRDRA